MLATAATPTRAKPGQASRSHRTPIGRYTDGEGRAREVVCLLGAHGRTLVVDRFAETRTDRRLLAHLSADEPAANAHLVCALYLADRRKPRCRALRGEDLDAAPEGEPNESGGIVEQGAVELIDAAGASYVLAAATNGDGPSHLRWHRRLPDGDSQSVTVRAAIGALESYEPVRSSTERAILAHEARPAVSVAQLKNELHRLRSSHIVLNRGLREAVVRALDLGEVTLSEIAIRCGRIKCDERGTESGETSWLARRIGLMAEGGHVAPTPWVSSDVLAVIARDGLGLAPREVELE